jgi:hypothetical protein
MLTNTLNETDRPHLRINPLHLVIGELVFFIRINIYRRCAATVQRARTYGVILTATRMRNPCNLR